jgi:myo-inositol-1(or 4)-monophosphatase
MTYIELFKEIGKQIITLNKYFGNKIATQEFEINPFGDKSVFIDKKAQDIIVETIIKQSIKCTLLSEESGLLDFGQKYPLFIVDPIDGSLNAKRGIPYSAFSIALAYSQTSDSILLATK